MSHRALGPQFLFHGTLRDDDFPSQEWVHMGTLDAAKGRLSDLQREGEKGTPRIYAARLHPDAAMHPGMSDEELNLHAHRGLETDFPGKTVFPYTNSHEDTGSDSYLVHRSAIAKAAVLPRHLGGL